MGDILNFDEYVANEDNFLNKINNIYISKNEIKILEKYGININNCKNIDELLYYIESYLNNIGAVEDLEWVSEKVSEYNYYVNTNK